ncbi:MAG: FAD-dependent oxidoreductase [Oscillatoriales cyanobacterium SM2_1_8]|nr:FAD-dependent oxidoreductase [Oscillatoriales cyanobacterium SM2_1_8]
MEPLAAKNPSRILLVQSRDRLLPDLPDPLAHRAAHHLRRLGVEVRLGTTVEVLAPDRLALAGETWHGAVVWTAGLVGAPLLCVPAPETVFKQRLAVRDTLQLPDWDNVYAIGDLAAAKVRDRSEYLTGVAPEALQQGVHVARNLQRQRRGAPPQPFAYLDKGRLAVIGGYGAVGKIGPVSLSGFWPWLLWFAVHGWYLPGAAPAIALPARPNATPITPAIGNTNSPTGGGVNFDRLTVTNAPQVLQGFPTNNLQGLFAEVPLRPGQPVAEAALAAYGLTWGQPQSETTPLSEFTSLPGVKILQPEGFENRDLLQLLTDPTLSPLTKQRYYLNSLFWSAFAAREPEITDRLTTETSLWQRVYISRPLNQTLLVYGEVAPTAQYTNRFVNLGLSGVANLQTGQLDGRQSVNNLVGMLLGGVFLAVNPAPLREGLQEARSQQEAGAAFAPLTTQVPPATRRAINQRLNESLFYGDLVSGLEQVSGRLAFSQSLEPNHSSLFQVRAGLHRRVLTLSQRDIPEPTAGPTEIASVRTSLDKFPLTFLGATVPTNLPSHQAEAAQVVATTPDGREFVQELGSPLTTVPVGIQRSILAFDRIELGRVDRQTARLADFRGFASLPSLEAAWNGSSNGFQYAVNSGIWFNVAPNAAGPVADNNRGAIEPSLGAFGSALVNWSYVQVEREGDHVTAVTYNAPILRMAWNSAATPDNNNLVSLAYAFRRQVQGWEFALTPGAALVFDAAESRGIAFVQGNFATFGGLEVNGSIESDRQVFWRLEGTQRLGPQWAVGGYAQNFREIVQGIDTRVGGTAYGLTVKYTLPQSRLGLESQVGIAEDSVEARFRGSLRF